MSILKKTRSFRSALTFYFLPTAVIPLLVVGWYASNEMQQLGERFLLARSTGEKEAFLSEWKSQKNSVFQSARKLASSSELKSIFQQKEPLLAGGVSKLFKEGDSYNLYRADGSVLFSSITEEVVALDKFTLRELWRLGELEHNALKAGGVLSVLRILVSNDKKQPLGILEKNLLLDKAKLQQIKQHHQVDTVWLDDRGVPVLSSLAVSNDQLKELLPTIESKGPAEKQYRLVIENLDYAVFRYEVEMSGPTDIAQLLILVSRDRVSQVVDSFQRTLLVGVILFSVGSIILILAFSNLLVNPIVSVIKAMKHSSEGLVEPISVTSTNAEMQILIHSFNEMTLKIREARQKLEEKVHALHLANEEIQSAQGNLVRSAKLASLGQLVAGVAHELNNPIGFIYSNLSHLKGYTDNIKSIIKQYNEIEPFLPKEQQEKLQKSKERLEIDYILKDISDLAESSLEGAQRTRDIVLGLRNFARTEQTHAEDIKLSEMINSCLKLLENEIKNRIEVETEMEESLQIRGYRSQLNQVFLNLLSNAVHAIPAKGKIHISIKSKEENVVIEIKDTGCGISPDILPNIFDPFFTTKKVGQGMGLGLSIVYGLIEEHKGSIRVDSQVGQGSVFKVVLPKDVDLVASVDASIKRS